MNPVSVTLTRDPDPDPATGTPCDPATGWDSVNPNHTDRAHAEFSPSALKYLHTCPGFHGNDGSSAAADMGTRIHEALEVRDPTLLQSEEEVEIYDQLLKDEEEVFAYVFGGDDDFVKVFREMRLHLDLDAQTPTFGTCDIVAHDGKTALVADYKTGISFIDPPRENWQAKAYTLGVFQTNPDIRTIHFAFLVPRNGGVIVGTFERSEMGVLRDQISMVVGAAESTRPKWEAGTMDIDDLGPSHNCRFCRHEDHCPALGAVAIEVAERAKSVRLLPDGPIRASEVEDPETMAKLYLVARIVEEWASGIKFKALSMVLAGTELPGLRLKSMGTPLEVQDNINLANLAKQHGLTMDDILETANLSLNKLGEVLGSRAPRGMKGKTIDAFREEAVDLGVAVEGKTKYTLAQTKQDNE